MDVLRDVQLAVWPVGYSVGGSATGVFTGRDDNLVKLIIYHHWVHFVKAAWWRVRGRVKYMKDLVQHVKAHLTTLQRVINYEVFGGLRVEARFTDVETLTTLKNWLVANDFFSLPMLSRRTPLHLRLFATPPRNVMLNLKSALDFASESGLLCGTNDHRVSRDQYFLQAMLLNACGLHHPSFSKWVQDPCHSNCLWKLEQFAHVTARVGCLVPLLNPPGIENDLRHDNPVYMDILQHVAVFENSFAPGTEYSLASVALVRRNASDYNDP